MGRTLRTNLVLLASGVALVVGSAGVSEARTSAPSRLSCLQLRSGATQFCRAVEHRVAIRTVRKLVIAEAQRTHTKIRLTRPPLSWKVAKLRAANRWERSRLAYLRTLPTWIPLHLVPQFTCIHEHEGAWNDDTGNGYHGGLQMDWGFMTTYGADMLRKYGGAAELWSPRDQMIVAERAYYSGRGFGPWPNTARACGLL